MQQLAKECVSARKELSSASETFSNALNSLRDRLMLEMKRAFGNHVYVMVVGNPVAFCCYYQRHGVEVWISTTVDFQWRVEVTNKRVVGFSEVDKHFIACAQSIVDKLNGKE